MSFAPIGACNYSCSYILLVIITLNHVNPGTHTAFHFKSILLLKNTLYHGTRRLYYRKSCSLILPFIAISRKYGLEPELADKSLTSCVTSLILYHYGTAVSERIYDMQIQQDANALSS